MKFNQDYKSRFKILKNGKIALCLSVVTANLLLASPAPTALPTSANIVSGNIAIQTTNSNMTINQTTNQGIINWGSFNIGSAASVRFNQPNITSTTLNRVVGGELSQIAGNLSANGRVVLINPNGVIFSGTSRVDVGGIVATTMNLSDNDYLNGNYNFTRDGSVGRVINSGNITATDEGFVALLAPEVINEGVITARKGSVAFASGDKVTLDFKGDGLLNIEIDPATIATNIENKNLVVADGGLVYMSSKVASDAFSSTISNTGTIQANTIEERDGKIILSSEIVVHSGVITATSENGGGEILIGGDWQGKNPEINNAKLTIVEKDAIIDASAKTNGNGGKVVVWSDEITIFDGTIKSTGGSKSGDGGNVEVSGKGYLEFTGNVNTSAPNGKNGLLLLDPKNIIVADVDPGGGAIDRTDGSQWSTLYGNRAIWHNYTENGFTIPETSWVTPDAIQTQLASGNVILQAINDITINNDITSAATRSLSFQAGRSIFVNANITNSGTIGFEANKNNFSPTLPISGTNADAGTAVFTMDASKTITTTGGYAINITVSDTNAQTGNDGGKATIGKLNSSDNITILANDIDLMGGVDSITTTGSYKTLTLGTVGTTHSRNLFIGDNISTLKADAPTPVAAVDLVLTQNDINAINNTWHQFNINTAGQGGNGNAYIGDVTLDFSNNAGSIYIFKQNTATTEILGTIDLQSKQGFRLTSGGLIDLKADAKIKDSNSAQVYLFSDNMKIDGTINVGASVTPNAYTTLAFYTYSTNRDMLVTTDNTSNTDVNKLIITSNEINKGTGFGRIEFGNSALTGEVKFQGAFDFGTKNIDAHSGGVGGDITLFNSQITSGGEIRFLAGIGNDALFSVDALSSVTNNGSSKDIIFQADNINILSAPNSISGSGYLRIGAKTANRQIFIGDTGATASQLGLTQTEVNSFKDGFWGIIIGNTGSGAGTGGIIIGETGGTPFEFKDALTLYQDYNNAAGIIEAKGSLKVNNDTTGANLFMAAKQLLVNGDITLDANTGRFQTNYTVANVTEGSSLTIKSDDITIDRAWIGTGARSLQLTTNSKTKAIGTTGGNYTLDATELGYFLSTAGGTPSLVTIGNSSNTGDTVLGNISYTATDSLLSIYGSNITQVAATTLNIKDFTVGGGVAGKSVVLNNANNDFDIISILSNGANVSVTDKDELTIRGVNIPNYSGGTLSITTSGDIIQDISQAISLGDNGGAVTLNAGTGDIQMQSIQNYLTGQISATGNNITISTFGGLNLGAITSTGKIDISSYASFLTGNIAINGVISTTSTELDAIKINAGIDRETGQGTLGNVTIGGSGSLSVGEGGGIQIYTGTIDDTTFDTANGWQARYLSDETTVFSPALGSGKNIIYRVLAPFLFDKSIYLANHSTIVTGGTYGNLYSLAATVTGGATLDTTSTVSWYNNATLLGTTSLAGCSGTGCTVYYDLGANALDAATYTGLNFKYSVTNTGATYDSFTISPKNITVSGFTAQNKIYDSTTSAIVSGTLNSIISGDESHITLTGVFGDKNVANGKSVTAGLSGTKSGNYTLTSASTIANITPKALIAITDITASNKTYNGLTSATIDFASAGFTGIEVGDTLSISTATGAFDTKHVGIGKTVTVSEITLGGTDAGNYSLPASTTTTADITTKAVTITALNVSKEYDGELTYTATSSDLTSLSSQLGVSGDTITSIGLVYTDKNVGTDNKTINASTATINDGNNGLNYDITYASNSTSSITPKALTITAENKSKTYGDVNPALTYTLSQTLFGSDTFSGSLSTVAGQYDNVGEYDITSTLANSNYNITVNDGKLTINKKDIDILGLSGVNKIYDGTTTAILNGTATLDTNSIINSDAIAISGTALGNFANINVGDSKAITVSGMAISGAKAGNYNLTEISGLTADITARAITLTADAKSKTYGDVNPALTYQIEAQNGSRGLVNSDTFSGNLSTTATQYSNVGDYSITSSLANSNYAITYVGDDLTIGQRGLSVIANDNKKIVGLEDPTLTFDTEGFVGSDTVDTQLSGSIMRESGIAPGKYAITQGSLLSTNYAITFTQGEFTIEALPTVVNVTPPPPPPAPETPKDPLGGKTPINGGATGTNGTTTTTNTNPNGGNSGTSGNGDNPTGIPTGDDSFGKQPTGGNPTNDKPTGGGTTTNPNDKPAGESQKDIKDPNVNDKPTNDGDTNPTTSGEKQGSGTTETNGGAKGDGDTNKPSGDNAQDSTNNKSNNTNETSNKTENTTQDGNSENGSNGGNNGTTTEGNSENSSNGGTKGNTQTSGESQQQTIETSNTSFDGLTVGATANGNDVKAIVIQGASNSATPITLLVSVKTNEGFSFSVPTSVVSQVMQSPTMTSQVKFEATTAVQADGKALPSWVSFDKGSMSFNSANVPEGGLPLTVKVIVTNGETTKAIEIVLK